MSDTPTAGEQQCGRCGDDFRLVLCEVHPRTSRRDRVEAYLCYDCRQTVTHRVIGGASV